MTTPAVARIAARDLSFSYGERPVLDGVSLEVAPGTIYGLLGPNGSGKSTLLSILTGSLPLQQGQVLLDGQAVDPMSRRYRREIGVVFQSPALDGKLTVRENLGLVATLHAFRGAAAREAVEIGLRMARLEERANSRVQELSGGMRRRLDIARALLPNPRILFMDEPTTGLDEASFRMLWEHLREANTSRDLTIIVSTHRPEEASLCETLCVLARGKVVAAASPQALCSQVADDLVVLDAVDASTSARNLRESMSLEVAVHGDELRVGVADGHSLIPRLFEVLPRGAIRSVAVRRPGLADAYLALTGDSLAGEAGDGAPEGP